MMRVVRDPLRSVDLPRGGIVTIGNFDGVHLGHRRILETVGALCLILGLFTRFFAVAIGIEFLLIVFNAHWGMGLKDFSWARPGGGWEYPLFWGLIIAAIALRGGGPYSLDRRLGREL